MPLWIRDLVLPWCTAYPYELEGSWPDPVLIVQRTPYVPMLFWTGKMTHYTFFLYFPIRACFGVLSKSFRREFLGTRRAHCTISCCSLTVLVPLLPLLFISSFKTLCIVSSDLIVQLKLLAKVTRDHLIAKSDEFFSVFLVLEL